MKNHHERPDLYDGFNGIENKEHNPVSIPQRLKEAIANRRKEIARQAFQAKLDKDAAEEAEFGPYIAANIKKKNGKLKK